MRDGLSSKLLKRVISPVSVADDTPQVGQIIDHQGYSKATYGILTGSIGDAAATFAVLLEEGDESDLSDAAAVADADMISQGANAPETDAAFDQGDDNEVRKLGYRGTKRYTRLTITPSGNLTAALLAAFCVLEGAAQEPVTQTAS